MADDEEEFDHQVTPWTVGQLRAASAGLPDDFPVSVLVAQEPGGEFADVQVVISAEPWVSAKVWPDSVPLNVDAMRAKLAAGEVRPDHLEISLEFPSGRYYRRSR